VAEPGLRILVVSDASPWPVAGDGKRAIWEMASRLAGRGHKVTLLGRSAPGAPAPPETCEGVSIQAYRADRTSPLRFLRTSILTPGRAASDLIRREGADVLHLHQPLSGYGVLSSAEGSSIPCLYTFHAPAPLEYRARAAGSGGGGGLTGLVGAGTLRILERACLKKARRVHVLSEHSARLTRKLYRVSTDRLVKIPGGADLERFHPAADRTELRTRLGLPRSGPLLLTVRNLEACMGLDHLVHAVKALEERRPSATLVIGGDGPLRNELAGLVRSLGLEAKVRLTGFIPDEDLPAYYQAADLFILPSVRFEGFGLVAIEALACGTPVLGSRVGATPEILKPLDPDLVFWDHSPGLFADDLDRFLGLMEDSPGKIESLRDACAAHAARHYSWESAVDRLEETLADLAAVRALR